jgi:hypothetical protein
LIRYTDHHFVNHPSRNQANQHGLKPPGNHKNRCRPGVVSGFSIFIGGGHEKSNVANSIVILGLGLALLITTLLTRTILLTSKQVQVEGRPSNVSIDRNEAARRLSHAIQFKTISHSDEIQFDKAAFIDFQNYIEQAFPLVHAQLTKEIINQYSLLYT